MSSALISVGLAIIFYFIIILCYKWMGKREISELSIFDFVMNLIIADIVATGIVQEDYWLDSLGGLLALVIIQVVMARIQLKKAKIRKYFNGESSIIIKDGKIDYEELTKLRIQLDELMMILRQSNVPNIEDIQYAIMESNGRLSIYEKRLPTEVFPLPFIISGQIKPFAIKSADVTEQWVKETLEKHQITIDDQLKYLLYDRKHFIIHKKTGVQKIRVADV